MNFSENHYDIPETYHLIYESSENRRVGLLPPFSLVACMEDVP